VVHISLEALQCKGAINNFERLAHYNNLDGCQGSAPGFVSCAFSCYDKRVSRYGELNVYAPVKSEVRK
jgi:hypothetical protein